MADDLTGRVLAGRYRLDRLLAVGGMSRVWVGTDSVLSRRVAVKVLHPHLASDRKFVQRFRREAVAVARLNHPSIVAIYDTCSEQGCEAIVMELVNGVNLRQWLDRRGPMPVRDVLSVGGQAAAALSDAHHVGIIHRDIKPANILLAADDPVDGSPRALVTDFGVAKALDETGTDTGELTRTGLILGTAKYLSPEQVEGQPVDARTDVYALGLVLYEALCGRPPWSGDSTMSMALARLRSDPLRPRQVRADIPREVERIVLQAMARSPEDRYATAADLRAALLAARRRLPPEPEPDVEPTAPVGPSSFVRSERSWLVPSGLVVAVAVALVLGALAFGNTQAGHDLVDKFSSAFGRGDDAAGADASSTTLPPLAPLSVGSLSSVDPRGDGEHDEELANLIDHDPATTWQTSSYNENFPSFKPGVGVAFQLQAASPVRELRITTPQTGWSAQVYVAPRGGSSTGVDSWGEPVASFKADTQTPVVDLPASTQGQAVLVWIDSLAPTSSGYRATMSDVELRG
jgi:serine/threonine protein kinase